MFSLSYEFQHPFCIWLLYRTSTVWVAKHIGNSARRHVRYNIGNTPRVKLSTYIYLSKVNNFVWPTITNAAKKLGGFDMVTFTAYDLQTRYLNINRVVIFQNVRVWFLSWEQVFFFMYGCSFSTRNFQSFAIYKFFALFSDNIVKPSKVSSLEFLTHGTIGRLLPTATFVNCLVVCK